MKHFKPPTKIEIKGSSRGGYGCFATEHINKGEVVEISKVLPIMKNTEFQIHAYPDTRVNRGRVLCLGYGSLYNHSDNPNLEQEEYENNLFRFIAIKDILKGEELLIKYGNAYFSSRDIEKK